MHPRSVSLDALDLGDCIGVESCVDFKTTVVMDVDVDINGDGGGGSRTSEKMERVEKGFPPPIPSLSDGGEDCPVAMPWVMKRYYSGDGRLVIRGERVKRREYFTADRSNGRLTLRLFPLNDDDDDENGGDVVDNDDQTVAETEEEESMISNREAVGSFLGNGGAPVMVVGGGGGGGGGKLYQCCNMRRSSCMLEEIAMAAVGSVHT